MVRSLLRITALAISGTLGTAAIADTFSWLSEPPELSRAECEAIPIREMAKIADCSLTFSLRVDRPVRREIDVAMSLFARTSTWDWLDARPLVDCEALPTAELQKFGCRSSDGEGFMLASEVLAEMKDWRETLSSRYAKVAEQRAALEQVSSRIAAPEQRDELDALEELENRLRARQAQAELLGELARIMPTADLSGFDLSGATFKRVTEQTTFSSTAGRIRRQAEAGDLVLVVSSPEEANPTALHIVHGLGTLSANSLGAVDQLNSKNR